MGSDPLLLTIQIKHKSEQVRGRSMRCFSRPDFRGRPQTYDKHAQRNASYIRDIADSAVRKGCISSASDGGGWAGWAANILIKH